jgi:hypothetical protein
MHVPCALRGAMPGPGRAAIVLMALLAVGAAAYAAVRVSLVQPPAPAPAPTAEWGKAVAEAEARLSARIDEAHAQEQAAIAEAAKDLRQQADRGVLTLDGRLQQFTGTTENRFRANEDRIQEIAGWVRDVKDAASKATAVAPANPAPMATTEPPPVPAAGGSGTPPVVGAPHDAPQPPPPGTGPTPAPVDPQVERQREAEVDRWIERLKDREPGISFSATVQLGRLKSLRAVPALVTTLQKHSDFYTRLGAATALGELKAVDAIPALIGALDDKDDLVQTAASEALTSITGQDFKFVVNLTKKERNQIRDQWTKWWKDNEPDLRQRLGQPVK